MPTSIDASSNYLLDGNLLIAFHDTRHGQFNATSEWMSAHDADSLFLCSVTEGTLLRFLMSPLFGAKLAAAKAWDTLREFRARPNVLFLDAGFSYLDVQTQGLTGHKEVTDAWLITLARRQGCRLATLDKGLVARHPDTTELLKS